MNNRVVDEPLKLPPIKEPPPQRLNAAELDAAAHYLELVISHCCGFSCTPTNLL
jgi:hypothetical protein